MYVRCAVFSTPLPQDGADLEGCFFFLSAYRNKRAMFSMFCVACRDTGRCERGAHPCLQITHSSVSGFNIFSWRRPTLCCRYGGTQPLSTQRVTDCITFYAMYVCTR